VLAELKHFNGTLIAKLCRPQKKKYKVVEKTELTEPDYHSLHELTSGLNWFGWSYFKKQLNKRIVLQKKSVVLVFQMY